MKILTLLAALLIVSLSPLSAQTKPQGDEEYATIYVYRNFYHTTVGRAAPDVSVNGEKLARLDEGRYFIAKVRPGFTIVACGKKKANKVEFDAKAGETYYMRIRAHSGLMFARFEMFRVTKEEAQQDAEKLRYVESGDIKSERVQKDAPKP